MAVVLWRLDPGLFRWNDGLTAPLSQERSQGVTVVGLVGQEGTGLCLRDETRCRDEIVSLPLGDLERQGQTEGVHNQVDLGRQATTWKAASYAIGSRPPFPPAPC